MMATSRPKDAARPDIAKAWHAQSARAYGENAGPSSEGTNTAESTGCPGSSSPFPERGKEPLTDARHVLTAIARFGQLEGVSDAERDQAWQRIRAAAKRYDVEAPGRGPGEGRQDRKR